MCQTYRHLEESALDAAGQDSRLATWRGFTEGHVVHGEFGLVSDCVVGETDPADGIATRVVREVEMLDETANIDGDRGQPDRGQRPDLGR
jgi:hypothetical protein